MSRKLLRSWVVVCAVRKNNRQKSHVVQRGGMMAQRIRLYCTEYRIVKFRLVGVAEHAIIQLAGTTSRWTDTDDQGYT